MSGISKYLIAFLFINVIQSCCEKVENNVVKDVMNAYSNCADSLKIEAVKFLCDNIIYHSFLYSESIEKGKEWYRIMRENDSYSISIKRDSLIKTINPYEPIKLMRDIDYLDSSYLCENIDYAFKVWREQPWGKNVSYDLFCEYILPYRIADEIPERWRKEYYEKYNPLMDDFRNSKEYDIEDPVEAAKYLLNKLPYVFDPIYSSQSFMAFPHIGPKYVQFFSGSCREFSDFVIYVCRALGIPCAFNESLNMHRTNQGHHWASFWNKNKEEYIISNYPPVLVPNRQDYTMGAEKVKVYRNKFSLNKETYRRGQRCRKLLKPMFRIPLYDDVTAIYTNMYIHKVVIPIEDIERKIDSKEPIYICSSSKLGWVAEDFSYLTKSGAVFPGLQTGEVLCVCVNNHGVLKPITTPFVIDPYSHQIKYFNPYPSKRSIILKSKFTITAEEHLFQDRMVGGVFEASQNASFMKKDTLYTITHSPDRKITLSVVNDNLLHKYRYVRYKGPRGSYCNVAEIKFYNTECKPISPKSIIGSPSSVANHDYINAFDDNTQTSFVFDYPDDGWCGIEINEGERIGMISYTPRNRDNYINSGDIYELMYYNDGWESLGEKTANADTLVYDNVPECALFLLRNHSGGCQERIFSYEEGKQKWR